MVTFHGSLVYKAVSNCPTNKNNTRSVSSSLQRGCSAILQQNLLFIHSRHEAIFQSPCDMEPRQPPITSALLDNGIRKQMEAE